MCGGCVTKLAKRKGNMSANNFSVDGLETLVVKKNVKIFPVVVPSNLQRYIPLKHRNKRSGLMVFQKGDEIKVHPLLAKYLKERFDYFKK